MIYAKIFIKNKNFWARGIIIEAIGSVMYNVWIEDDRRTGLIRSNTNQLKMRYKDPQKSTLSNVPLQTLLEVFEEEPSAPAIIPEPLLEDVIIDTEAPLDVVTDTEVNPPEMTRPARIISRRLPARFEPYVLY